MSEWTVKLSDKGPFKWYNCNRIWVKGYAFIKNEYYEGAQLGKQINNRLETGMKFERIVSSLNGAFLILHNKDDVYEVAADIVQAGGFLYYDCKNKMISDDSSVFLNLVYSFDEIGIKENFKSLLYTIDNRTYLQGVRHLSAGEIVVINKITQEVKRTFYYMHRLPGKNIKDDKNDYLSEINQMSISVFIRLIKSLQGKTAIIPLSGGYDSRYIAVMLHELGYKNVVCYTYGYSKNTEETGISKLVAEKLGYKHFFVYQDDNFWKEFLSDKVVNDYLFSSHDISHTPHIQEIRALELLQKEKDFPKDGVVIPGFCGDLFGGSYTIDIHQKKQHKYDLEELCTYIASNHFTAFSKLPNYKESLIEDLRSFFLERKISPNDLETFNEAFSYWFCSHKVAKYVIPSLRAYESFGYEWRLPLWDIEMTNYWYNIPICLKQNISLYDYSLMQLYFVKNEVGMTKEEGTRLQIEKQHRKIIKVIGYAAILLIYYKTGKLFMKRDSNNFISILKNFYFRLKNKRFISIFENRWIEPFVLWEAEQLLGDKNVKKLFSQTSNERKEKK